MTKISILLILFRFLLAPIILLIAYFLPEKGSTTIVVLMYLGFLSDIFDGIIARKLNVSTQKMRRLDSQVDIVFWISIVVSAWIMFPLVFKNYALPIFLILLLEISCNLISIIRFKKAPGTHAYLAKFWRITLLVAFTALIGFGYSGFTFATALIVGIISYLESILIILILPVWTSDIPSIYHAREIRKNYLKKNE